ncbi:MAG: glycosyltransferase family 4 protein [Anaerolineae bacterium]|nr:glycosyltransferase family 4 protein [Anaerolineae bacterium]
MYQVICLLLAPQRCPSSRYCVYNFISYLRNEGIEVTALPFYSEDVYAKLAGMGAVEKVLHSTVGILKRISQWGIIKHADVVWIHRFAAPVATGSIASVVKAMKRPMIFSYDDAVYLQRGTPSVLRNLFGSWRGVDTAIIKSDFVLAWNHELEEHALQYQKKVRVLPSSIDVIYYDQVLAKTSRRTESHPFILGWIGTPSSAPYLEIVRPVLERLAQEGPVELRLIGGDIPDIPGVTIQRIPWQQGTEVQELCQADVGIAPLAENPWTRGKSGLKVIQYMGCGLPVVASAVGAHLEIIENGKQGFLVNSEDAWLQALRTLRDNNSLCLKMGSVGRETVHQKHDFSVVAGAIADVCRQLC